MKKLKDQSWLLYFTTPLLALLLGWAQWDWGKPAFSDWAWVKGLTLFGIFLLSTHFFLVLPVVHWVWKPQENSSNRFKLISLSAGLLSLPLISFSYWWGEVRTLLQAQEVTMSIIPAVVLSVLIYDCRRKSEVWSFALASMVFFNLFLVNEILGPFSTYVYLLSHDYRFDYLRALVPVVTIALFYRLEYEPNAKSFSSFSRINSIHHAWKSRRFSQVFKATDPRKSSLKAESESGVGNGSVSSEI